MKIQELNDHTLAKNIAEEGRSPPPDLFQMQSLIDDLKKQQKRLFSIADNQEQYTRKEILVYEEIPYQDHPNYENTTEVVLEFTNRYLGLNLNKFDISTSHRVIIPEDKRRMGRDYIPPIYCKFVHREVVHAILQRKHWLKHEVNTRGKKFIISENLTLIRRKLKEKVENELTSYRFKWVKNGNIFVKKTPQSRPIKITDDEVLQHLIKEQNENRSQKAAVARRPPMSMADGRRPPPSPNSPSRSIPNSRQEKRYASSAQQKTHPSQIPPITHELSYTHFPSLMHSQSSLSLPNRSSPFPGYTNNRNNGFGGSINR